MICKQCGLCCSWIVTNTISADGDYARWTLYRGGHLEQRGDQWILYTPSKCCMLTMDNKCRMYENRPEMCKKFPEDRGRENLPSFCKYYE